ncbi:MAG: ribonuclease P protein component [Candidatus Eremiobacteraeota bacterium]|nr:ribonuclease P protein component [Candidatus Eremiobacteraeota bacterium]
MHEASTLKHTWEFSRIITEGRSVSHRLLVLYISSAGPSIRFGICVGKKIGSSVARNRIKRKLREIVRLNINRISPGWDFVLVARAPSSNAAFHLLQEGFLEVCARAGILNERQER